MRCVSDANIWIDLDAGGLLGRVFDLADAWVIPDLVAEELRTLDVDLLVEFGLEVQTLIGDQLNEVVALATAYPRPSPQDLATLVVARDEGRILVTGDGALREAAEAEGLEVHGMLWLLDRMVSEAVLTPPEAGRCLRLIIHHGSRLPDDEVDRRLRRWK